MHQVAMIARGELVDEAASAAKANQRVRWDGGPAAVGAAQRPLWRRVRNENSAISDGGIRLTGNISGQKGIDLPPVGSHLVESTNFLSAS